MRPPGRRREKAAPVGGAGLPVETLLGCARGVTARPRHPFSLRVASPLLDQLGSWDKVRPAFQCKTAFLGASNRAVLQVEQSRGGGRRETPGALGMRLVERERGQSHHPCRESIQGLDTLDN